VHDQGVAVTHTAASPTYRRLKRPLADPDRAGAGAFRDNATVDEGWHVTAACAAALGASGILFQCPAGFRPTDENAASLASFFRRIDRPQGARLLWQRRGPWPPDLVASLCAAHALTHVVDPSVSGTVTAGGVTYYRLHGVTGSRHVYTDDELRVPPSRPAAHCPAPRVKFFPPGLIHAQAPPGCIHAVFRKAPTISGTHFRRGSYHLCGPGRAGRGTSTEVRMFDDHDTRLELNRQLAVVRDRIDETVTKLVGLKDGLTAAGLGGVPAASMAEGKGDLFNLCVRLEVALADSVEWAAKLSRRLEQLSGGEPAAPDHAPITPPPSGDGRAPERPGDGLPWLH
jgi:hypothetical protein